MILHFSEEKHVNEHAECNQDSLSTHLCDLIKHEENRNWHMASSGMNMSQMINLSLLNFHPVDGVETSIISSICLAFAFSEGSQQSPSLFLANTQQITQSTHFHKF